MNYLETKVFSLVFVAAIITLVLDLVYWMPN
jgi:hypothetical protein